jgi:short-subunit dehydrogenase
MSSINGKVAVTGAARGIGRVIALRLAADGADLAINDAGIAQAKLLLETDPEDLEALIRVNVFGVVGLTHCMTGRSVLIEGGLVMR